MKEAESFESDESNVLDLLILLARRKKTLLFLPFFIATITAAASLLLPDIYVSSSRLLPPLQGSGGSAAAMLSQLGGGFSGLAGGALIKNPADLYVALLKSRTVGDKIIGRFTLQSRYKAKTMSEARNRLQNVAKISSTKEGLITVDIEDKDPELAAKIANAYAEELDVLMQGVAVTEAGRRRVYFEKQLSRVKDELSAAESELRKTQEKTGLIDPGVQGKAIIESIAMLRAQITSREVALGAMKSFATDNNPDAIRIRGEIAELQTQLAKRENPAGTGENRGDSGITSGKVPELGLEYARKLREVKYHEVLFELMAKQYEMARADEAKEPGTLQVIDRAIPADKKSKPKRLQFILMAYFVSLIATACLLLVGEGKRRLESNVRWSKKISELKRSLLL